MVTLYNVISADGFIARSDGSEAFIPNSIWPNFLDLCKEYGALIMGRKTYDTIQAYPNELLIPFEKLPIKKIVVTNNQGYKPKDGYIVTHSPEEALALNPNALISSGPILNNYLLENNLIGKIILHQVSTLIYTGIKPFKTDALTLIQIKDVPQLEGIKVREYKVLPAV